MSSAKTLPGKESATLQTTRQMLDELDALMNRMLAIPVTDLDAPAPVPREIASVKALPATPTVLERPVEQEIIPARENPEPLRESFPSYQADLTHEEAEMASLPRLIDPTRLVPPPTSAEPDLILEEVIPSSMALLPAATSAPSTPETPLALFRLPRRSLASRILLPLQWSNRLFDVATMLLGSPGQWLRGPHGRHILGLTGLALLGAAGIWLVKDWLGWTW